ncbi:MAG: hypothetical protein VYA34_13415 [Myxococcota bacterium]|nr:hypothetical protein [Myxococcota bacterium]
MNAPIYAPAAMRLNRTEGKGSRRRDAYINQEEFQTSNGVESTEKGLRCAIDMATRFGHFHHCI